MKKFATINSLKTVTNVVVAESFEIISTLLPEETIVEVTEETKEAFIGASYSENDKKFIPYKPYNSWVWDSASWSWNPPSLAPNDGKPYYWNESTISWEPVSVVDIE